MIDKVRDRLSDWHTKLAEIVDRIMKMASSSEGPTPEDEYPDDELESQPSPSSSDTVEQPVLAGRGPQAQGQSQPPASRIPLEPLMKLGVDLWRTRRSISSLDLDQDSLRIGARHLQSAIESYRELGFEIRDHTDERFPEKGVLNVEVISFEPRSDLDHEVILETVRPSILLHGSVVHRGQVIVGTPKIESEGSEEMDDPPPA